MNAKRLITAYILLLCLAIFSACSPQTATAAEAEEADIQGWFILLLVSADAREEEADVAAQALPCLSREDLRKAA